MKTARHTIYTEIPLRSFNALVGDKETIENLLIALMVDELESEDVANYIWKRPQNRPLVTSRAFFEMGANATDAWKRTLSQWCMRQDSAPDALVKLTIYNWRLGVWCACQLAQDALRLIRIGGRATRTSIEMTKAWVAGKVTIDRVISAGDEAEEEVRDGASDMQFAVGIAASEAARGASVNNRYSAAYMLASAARRVARAEAEAAYDDLLDNVNGYEYQIVRLREGVADACLSFPPEAMR